MKIEEINTYSCPYCSKEYEKFDDASDCATECADIEPVEQEIKNIYICDYCKDVSQDVLKIERCEKQHELDQDDFYHHERLNQAREHPSQAKLGT